VKLHWRLGSILLALSALSCLHAQNCPPNDMVTPASGPSTLVGVVRYHDELRQWMGLEVNPPVCGQKEIQLTFYKGDPREARAIGGCVASMTGSIGRSSTGYYSRDMYIDDPRIEADSSCHRVPVPMDPSKARIAPGVLSYEATLVIDMSKNKPMEARVWRTDGKTWELAPWQAYIDPDLTGSLCLWVSCRKGYYATSGMATVNGHTESTAPNGDIPGMCPSETSPSSITITCAKNSNQLQLASANK
jgi:hypothetical protein